jgi:protein arginine kinase
MTNGDSVRDIGRWLLSGTNEGVVISSRVRLARNLRNAAFPGWAGEEECIRLYDRLRDVFGRSPMLKDSVVLDMGSLEPVEKEVLKERQLISRELAEKGRGSGVAVSAENHLAVMINEEDHLRLQAISLGIDLLGAWGRLNALDTELEALVEYAFSPRLGYLTACPSNVGTGLRASAMLHLVGLRLMNEIEAVVRGLEKIGLAVRGLHGEGTEARGDMFQVSNQVTLGESEETIVNRLGHVVKEVVEHEQNARLRLLDGKRTRVLDLVGRSFGLLLHAHVLSSMEAVDYISSLRLGVECGIVANLSLGKIHELLILIQSGHFQRLAGKLLSQEERDEYRAILVRQKMRNVTLLEG